MSTLNSVPNKSTLPNNTWTVFINYFCETRVPLGNMNITVNGGYHGYMKSSD